MRLLFVNIRIESRICKQILRITKPLRLGHLKEMLTPEDAEPAAKKVGGVIVREGESWCPPGAL